MERTLKIFISCALGAGIGALTALQLNQYFWWIGMIVGGLIGYLSYEIKQVLAAIPQAWGKVSGWKPKRETVLTMTYLFLWFFLWFLFLCAPFFIPITDVNIAIDITLLGLTSSIGSLIISSHLVDPSTTLTPKTALILLKFTNPFAVFFYWLPKGILWLVVRIPRIIVKIPTFFYFIGRFVKQMLILIHSDIRLMCGVDAAIGAGIGYFAGNAIIGAIAGGVFGIINYKLISQKVLKLHLKTNH